MLSKSGFGETSITRAPNGDLVGYMQAELNSAASREEERLVHKDKR
jgi:hypothetical protein